MLSGALVNRHRSRNRRIFQPQLDVLLAEIVGISPPTMDGNVQPGAEVAVLEMLASKRVWLRKSLRFAEPGSSSRPSGGDTANRANVDEEREGVNP